MENPTKGDKVRLTDRGSDRVGKIENTTRAISPDGKREVTNCHVRFPEVEGAKRKLPECVEVHQADALELA